MDARILSLIDDIKLPNGWTLGIHQSHDGRDDYLQVCDPKGIDNVTGQSYPWGGCKWRLSKHMTDAEVVQTAFLATMSAVEHETREQFLYKGVSIFDPHYDIEQLYLLRVVGALDKREDPTTTNSLQGKHTS